MKKIFSLFFLFSVVLSLAGCASPKANGSSADISMADSQNQNGDQCHWLSTQDASAIIGHTVAIADTSLSGMEGLPCNYTDKAEYGVLFAADKGETELDLERYRKSFPGSKDANLGEASFVSTTKNPGNTAMMPTTSAILYVYQKGHMVVVTATTPTSENNEAALIEKAKKIASKIMEKF